MTRTATKPGRAKRALEATSWSELSAPVTNAKPARKRGVAEQSTKSATADSSTNTTPGKKASCDPTVRALKNIRRTEKRRLKRQMIKLSEMICYNCREKGHVLSKCPKNKKIENGTGVCFHCGSTEHTTKSCREKLKKRGTFPFATCFICKGQGHISKFCPENDHGLYPNGGCCLECGSKQHFKRDCPEKQKKQGIESMTLGTLDNTTSADVESESSVTRKPVTVRKRKIVTM